jgi:predicted transcriptional regulator
MEEIIIKELMHDNNIGRSITEIVKLTNLSRSAVRTCLAHMEGAGKIKVRKIGMAKVYILNLSISEINRVIEYNNSSASIIRPLIHQFQKNSNKEVNIK